MPTIVWPHWAMVTNAQSLTSLILPLQNAKDNNDLGRQRESDHQCVIEATSCDTLDIHTQDTVTIQEKVKQYSKERQQRIELFLQNLYDKRNKFFLDLSDEKRTETATKCS